MSDAYIFYVTAGVYVYFKKILICIIPSIYYPRFTFALLLSSDSDPGSDSGRAFVRVSGGDTERVSPVVCIWVMRSAALWTSRGHTCHPFSCPVRTLVFAYDMASKIKSNNNSFKYT